jgi:Squalene-hopene cyclase C-terminal domain/Prenyltransferase and squalene oxidase repeat
MKTLLERGLAVGLCAGLAFGPAAGVSAGERERKPAGKPALVAAARPGPAAAASGAAVAAVNSREVKRGVEWLLAHQLRDGGWGQGDESPDMGNGMAALRDTSNVADTSMALLALGRAGYTPTRGGHEAAVRRGVDYVLAQIEASDADSLAVTAVHGTRVQAKIGTYVDTFASLLLLTEFKAQMGAPEANARLDRALAKVLHKVERNQTADGAFRNEGWAPALSQSLASKGLNRAAQQGAPVSDQMLERVERKAQSDYRSGSAAAASSAAGVELYAGAANLGAMRDSVQTRRGKKAEWERQAQAEPASPKGKAALRALEQTAVAEREADSAQQDLVARLSDPDFVRGFGSNGGEEFLSYMLVSEGLLAKGGKDFERWNQAITKLVQNVQNADGSWTGHHCITGRTFCTATALLVLMGDRAALPTASRLRQG